MTAGVTCTMAIAYNIKRADKLNGIIIIIRIIIIIIIIMRKFI